MEVLTRTFAPDLELRANGDGRTVYGIAVPFDHPTRISEGGSTYTEIFKRGAFARTIAERGDKVKAYANHDRTKLPLGRATELREDSAGLYAELRISDTRNGNEVLELVRDGALDSFSIGFRPIEQRDLPDAVVERTEVALSEISVVAYPAYEAALIGGVRTLDDDGTADVEDDSHGEDPADQTLVAVRKRRMFIAQQLTTMRGMVI